MSSGMIFNLKKKFFLMALIKRHSLISVENSCRSLYRPISNMFINGLNLLPYY